MRDAMEASPADDVKAIIEEQAKYVDVRVIGEFEDPDWVVEPHLDSHAPDGPTG